MVMVSTWQSAGPESSVEAQHPESGLAQCHQLGSAILLHGKTKDSGPHLRDPVRKS
jgi:hypothetical protein